MSKIISLRPCVPNTKKRESYLEHLPYIGSLLDEAGQNKPDLVCLPEDFLYQNGAAEPIDGPICQMLSQKAKEYETNIVGSLHLSDNGKKYGSAVVFDSQGNLTGRYDKTHLTKMEKEQFGLTAGDKLPVFDLDIGRVGVVICADMLFPELARCLALDGAELIVFPHQQAEPSLEFEKLMVCSRAQDNCVYIVCCTFAAHDEREYYPNWIVAPDGKIIAEGPRGEGMTELEIDIHAKVRLQDYFEFGEVDLWDIHKRYRRPELYKRLTE